MVYTMQENFQVSLFRQLPFGEICCILYLSVNSGFKSCSIVTFLFHITELSYETDTLYRIRQIVYHFNFADVDAVHRILLLNCTKITQL